MEQKPHVLTATMTMEGYPNWDIECPYDGVGRERPCLMGAEPDICLWEDWENGDHHPQCAKGAGSEAKAVFAAWERCEGVQEERDSEHQPCWEANGLPDGPGECDGFDVLEIGHCHEIDGCWAKAMLDDPGWDDGVGWRVPTLEIDTDVKWLQRQRAEVRLVLPMEVYIGNEDGMISLEPVDKSLIVPPPGAILAEPATTG